MDPRTAVAYRWSPDSGTREDKERGVDLATTSRSVLSDEGASRAVDAAVEEARIMLAPITVVIVDEGGNLKALRRMDGAPLVSIETARNKAYAAAAIGMPVDDFFLAIREDVAAVASFASRPGLALIAGGLPLLVDDELVGGIGVAGAMTGAADRRIAEAGAQHTRA
jgi:uncharacterized protein GlcG (DUF336 family)